MHSGSQSGHAAGARAGHPFAAWLQACRDTLRKALGAAQGKPALTARHRAGARRNSDALRLQLSYAQTPLTPGETRVTATAAVLRPDGTDLTATFAPSAWTWRQASGLAMRAGYGAVAVDTEGQARGVSVCPLGVSVSLSGTSRAACQDLAWGVEVTMQLPNGERLVQRFHPGLAGLE